MPSSKRSRSGVLGAPTPFHAVLGGKAEAAGAADSLSAAAATAATMQRLVAAVEQAGSELEAQRALAALRRALSVHRRPPIREAIDVGVLDVLKEHIVSTSAAVQAEAAWVLTNLCSGSSVETLRVVAHAGLVESVCRALLTEEGPLTAGAAQSELCNQLLWALGNMAADEDVSIRDRLLGFDVVQTLGGVFEQMPGLCWGPRERTQVLRTMTWLASSLCRGSPPPPLEEVECFFDYFVQVLCGTDDAQMLTDAMWGLHYLVEGARDASLLLSAGAAPGEAPSPHPAISRVVECTGRAGDARSPLAVPALKLLGSLASAPGDAGHAAAGAAIAARALPALAQAVQDPHAPDEVRRDAAWALANVARGTGQQSRQLVEDTAVWRALCDTSLKSPPSEFSVEVRRWCTLAAAEALGRLGGEAIARVDFREASCLLSQGARTAQAGAVAGALARVQDRDAPSAAPPARTDAELQAALLSAAEALMRHPGVEENLFQSRVIDGFAVGLQRSPDDAVSQKAIDLMVTWHSLINEVETSPAQRRGGENSGGQQRTAAQIDFESPKRRPSGLNDENMHSSPNRLRTPQRTPKSKPPSAAGTPACLGGC